MYFKIKLLILLLMAHKCVETAILLDLPGTFSLWKYSGLL